jgi:hypothetical protein
MRAALFLFVTLLAAAIAAHAAGAPITFVCTFTKSAGSATACDEFPPMCKEIFKIDADKKTLHKYESVTGSWHTLTISKWTAEEITTNERNEITNDMVHDDIITINRITGSISEYIVNYGPDGKTLTEQEAWAAEPMFGPGPRPRDGVCAPATPKF